jgi:hypothetical protein
MTVAHTKFLRIKIELAEYGFFVTPSDSSFLRKYAAWLAALEMGFIKPISSEQERFVLVTKGREIPQSHAENLWIAFRAARACETCSFLLPPYYSPEFCPECVESALNSQYDDFYSDESSYDDNGDYDDDEYPYEFDPSGEREALYQEFADYNEDWNRSSEEGWYYPDED